MDENMYIVQYTNKNINIFTDGHIVHESMLVNEYLYEHVDTHVQEGIHEHKYAHNHVHEHCTRTKHLNYTNKSIVHT